MLVVDSTVGWSYLFNETNSATSMANDQRVQCTVALPARTLLDRLCRHATPFYHAMPAAGKAQLITHAAWYAKEDFHTSSEYECTSNGRLDVYASEFHGIYL